MLKCITSLTHAHMHTHMHTHTCTYIHVHIHTGPDDSKRRFVISFFMVDQTIAVREAVCCSVLQCVAVCCSVLQCDVV